MNYSLPGSSVHEILQVRILQWVAIPFSRGSSQPRDPTQVSCIIGRFFTIRATREALELNNTVQILKFASLDTWLVVQPEFVIWFGTLQEALTHISKACRYHSTALPLSKLTQPEARSDSLWPAQRTSHLHQDTSSALWPQLGKNWLQRQVYFFSSETSLLPYSLKLDLSFLKL